MGNLPEPSNEQKLTFIYQVLKAQESRRKRKIFAGFLKWLLLISLIVFIYVYRAPLLERSYQYITDSINNRIRQISEEQKAGILKGIQQLLPPSLEDTLRDFQKKLLSGTGNTDIFKDIKGVKTGTGSAKTSTKK